ncbi:unnamed protein product [Nippostrongylus brasiliensis]|uniref:ABC transporter domain-containing protein n=1 Tax=Nippostrongylus brasiliensis TaxID=27835 RepID=A0A0N4YVT7_NIPBR|nr:unnamed protein product [Nippostrongylus brasiliensis]
MLQIAYMALMVWTTTLVPSPTEQPSLKIDLTPFGGSSGDGYMLSSNSSDGRIHDSLDLNKMLPTTAAGLGAPSNFYVENVQNLTSYVLNLIKQIGSRNFGIHYPLGFERQYMQPGSANLRVLFNNFAFTSPPLAISVADSMLLSNAAKKNITLSVSNHPFPPVTQDVLKNRNYSNGAAYMISYAVIVCMALTVSAYCKFLIHERKKKSKHMQPFTKDFTTVLILLLAMALYGWTTIPFTYWFSYLFRSPPKGFTLIVMYNIITGMIGSIAIPIIQQTANDDIAYTWSIILSFFFPTYSISNIFTLIYNNEFGRQACQMLDCNNPLFKQNLQCCGGPDDIIYTHNILSDSGRLGIMWPVIFFGIQGFLYWYLVFAREYNLAKSIVAMCKSSVGRNRIADEKSEKWKLESHTGEDSDVIAEKSNVKTMDRTYAAVVVDDVKKW